jgi:hypothetical protein
MDVVRQLSNDLFAKAAAVVGVSHETTPGAITAEIIGLCESLNADPPVYVPVGDDPHGMYGFCNLGVLDKIKAEGGEIRFGWSIWEYPGVYLTAEFHAVWVHPTGNLVDITPKPDRETRIVFAGDPTLPPDFDFAKRPNNRRARIYQGGSRDARQGKDCHFQQDSDRIRHQPSHPQGHDAGTVGGGTAPRRSSARPDRRLHPRSR